MWQTNAVIFIDIGNGSAQLFEIAAARTNASGDVELTMKSGATVQTRLSLDEWRKRLEDAMQSSR